MKVKNFNSAFDLIESKNIKELKGKGYYLKHKKSGAKTIIIKNNDENKVFSISFRTPPEDNCGTPHILEHSVLCGSKKYPVKEPFVELIKSTLTTFINAFTFSDKTMYPVASKNEKDFMNLIDVYMDAVLNPRIYEEKEIFLQEGWHLEYDEKKKKYFYNGVVYNEMKGAYSSPNSILFSKIQQSLFPNNVYSYDSGGDPDFIPDLSYEKFINFHKKYYHPVNSYIFIYGNADYLKILEHLDKEYLSKYEKIEINSTINLHKPFKIEIEKTFQFPVLSEKELENNNFFSMNFVTGTTKNEYDFLGLNILEYILMETEASPLKKALIDAEIGKDIFGMYEIYIQQPFLSIIAKKSDKSKKEKFKEVIFKTLNNLVNKGIDENLVKSSINHFEFQLREADYQGFPAGLFYNILSLSSWLYEDSPWKHLEYEKILKYIKQNYKNRYFENLISKYLINNTHRSFVILEPEIGLLEKKNKKVEEKIEKFIKNLSPDNITKIHEENKRLKLRQTTPDKLEDLDKLPLLDIKDINKEPELIPLKIIEKDNTTILYNNIETKGISYYTLLFNLYSLPSELLQYAKLFSALLGKISTEKYNYMDLSNEINILTGGISFQINNFIEKGNLNKFVPVFSIKTKVLKENIIKSMQLIDEILLNSLFNDEKRIKTLISELKSRMEISLINAGHSFANTRVLSYISDSGKFSEITGGIEYYKFLKNIDNNFNKLKDEIIEKLNTTKNYLINKNNLNIGFAGENEHFNIFKNNLNKFNFEINKSTKKEWYLNFSGKNEGFIIPGQVQYVAKGFNFGESEFQYNGHLSVLKLIIDMDYLWNKIRVIGGAYGAFSYLNRAGFISLTSYRDPNLKETLEAYDNIYDYFNNLNLSEKEIRKYIIGTIGKFESVLTPSMKQEVSISRYFSHITDDDLKKEKEEILQTTFENLKKEIDFIKKIKNEGKYCVIGSKKKIEENKNLFDSIEQII